LRWLLPFFIKPKPKILLPLISKDGKVFYASRDAISGNAKAKIFMMQVENRGRFCDDAVDLKVHAVFEGKGECELLWGYPTEWEKGWKFEGINATDCLRKGLQPHISTLELEEHKRLDKNQKAKFLVFFTLQDGEQVSVANIHPRPTICLDIPQTCKVLMFLKGNNLQGKSFTTKPQAFNLKLNSWEKCILEEAK
jgi:hypothetical protein